MPASEVLSFGCHPDLLSKYLSSAVLAAQKGENSVKGVICTFKQCTDPVEQGSQSRILRIWI